MTRVLITCKQLQETFAPFKTLFDGKGIEVEMPALEQRLSEAELLPIIQRYDGVIAGDDEFTGRVLAKGVRLRIVSKWGVGVDAIDLGTAKQLGIRVTNTPNVFADEVGDVVIGYIVLLARQLHRLDQSVRAGSWNKVKGVTLRGKVLGVVGLGSIGRAVAVRGTVLGMEVVGHDVAPNVAALQGAPIRVLKHLDVLFHEADFISLNCNLTAENRHLLDSRAFSLMKPGVRIINTARGPLIDEAALYEALSAGRVSGAALDVFEDEPLPLRSPLRQLDSCIFGTHNSSNTREAVERVNALAIENLLCGLEEVRR